MTTSSDTADALSQQALRALHAGRIVEGAALYRRALECADGARVPIARHLRLLEGSGRPDAAAAVRRQALLAGADLSSRSIARGGSPRDAAAGYEALFARDIANARMISEYMIALSRMGASDALAAISDPGLLLRREPLPLDLEGGALLAGVQEALLASAVEDASWRSLRQVARVPRAHAIDHPGVRAVHAATRRALDRYIADVAASSHLIARWISQPYELYSWGVITRDEGGHSVPHRHEGCWAVAVAYIAGETRGDGAGALEVGAHPDGDAACPGWPRATIGPMPGTIVIMPAFYTHWTIPLAVPGLRISIAFNAAMTDDR